MKSLSPLSLLNIRRGRSLRWILLGLLPSLFLGLKPTAMAQDAAAQETASMAIFNALPADVPLFFDWNGEDGFPDGIRPGNSVGPMILPAQPLSLVAKAKGFLPEKLSLPLTAGQRVVLIAYPGESAPDPSGEGEKRRLHLVPLPASITQESRKSLEWPVVLVGKVPSVEVEVNGKKVLLQRNRPVKVGQGQRFVEIKQGDKPLAVASVEQPTDDIFVIFGDDPKALAGALIYR